MILSLFILLPLLNLFALFRSNNLKSIVTLSITSFLLTCFAVFFYFSAYEQTFVMSDDFHFLFFILDCMVLGYFFYVGIKRTHKKVYLLALLQILLYLYIEFFTSSDILSFSVDQITAMMLIVINLVGSLIIIYAHYYMEYEQCEENKKRGFIASLSLFVMVINILVLCDDWLTFFLFFELTTLFSYILISFRQDEISIKNALQALYINQIGGVFLLLAIIYNRLHQLPINFDTIEMTSFALILLSFAAFVKGANKPFENWLLGAMVAPTPVSAILHSATMVKIAPYIVLNVAVFFTATQTFFIALFGSFIFLVMVLQALNKTKFKEILAYSTIAMLAFMISIASYGSDATTIVLYLIFFHALTKAILFMCAGILEKKYHITSVEQFSKLFKTDKNLSVMILLSFAAMSLPPFGLFISKLYSFVFLADQIVVNIFSIIVVLFLVTGSALLVLLYFKIASIMFSHNDTQTQSTSWFEPIMLPNTVLFVILFISSIILFVSSTSWLIYLSLLFIVLFALLIYFKPFSNFKRVEVYNCAEKTEVKTGLFEYDFSQYDKKLTFVSVGLLVFMLVVLLWMA